MSKRWVYLLLLLGGVLLYELPSLLTLMRTGWEPIPPVLVADQMLYLNLSAIHHVSASEVVNPWYGTRVLVVDVPHLMFPVTFFLFRFLHGILGSSWTGAVLLWGTGWTTLTFIAAVFCVQSFFPEADRTLAAAAALALLVLQSPLIYLQEIRFLIANHSLFGIQLPYLRFAIPQAILPLVLAYWGLQARAFKNASAIHLGGMVLLQFAVFAAFPYFLPILALGTGISLLFLRKEQESLNWPTALLFAACCGALDFGYLFLAGFAKSHANVQFTLQFRPEMILPSIRPYMVLLVVGGGLAFLSRAPLGTKATAAGLAFANAIFGLANAFFAPEAQMLQHPQYMIGIVTWLPLIVFSWTFIEKARVARLRVAVICALVLVGLIEGVSSFRMMLSINLFQKAAFGELQPLNLSEQDLVIAPSRHSDDVSSWIPLMSSAKVLFTGTGENILSARQTQREQTTRQALYLMMTGLDLKSLIARTQMGSSDLEIRPLLQQTDQTYAGSPLAKDQAKLRNALRDRLAPLVSQFEMAPQTTRGILGPYRRILVVDEAGHGFFDPSAFSKWLTIEQSQDANGVKIYFCHSSLGSPSE
jgi:hypothetical protein